MTNTTIYALIIDFVSGERDTEFFAQRPSFRIDADDTIAYWEIREGSLNGGDSVVIDHL